ISRAVWIVWRNWGNCNGIRGPLGGGRNGPSGAGFRRDRARLRGGVRPGGRGRDRRRPDRPSAVLGTHGYGANAVSDRHFSPPPARGFALLLPRAGRPDGGDGVTPSARTGDKDP